MSPIDELPTDRLDFTTEKKLSWRWRRKRDRRAFDKLVLHNLREATLYAKHYCPPNLFSDGELVSLCYDVLAKSVPRYRPSFGLRFFAFTKNRVRGAVKRHCATLDIVKHASSRRGKEAEGPTFLPFTGGKDQIAEHLPEDDVVTCTLGGTTDFDFESIHRVECWQQVHRAIKELLNPRQRMMLRLIYFCGFNMQDIGRMLGISRSAVQATHAAALEILRVEFDDLRQLFIGT